MSTPIRKYGIILVVAVLFSIFVFSFANALIGEQEYPDTCQQAQDDRPTIYSPGLDRSECPELASPTQEEIDACPGQLHPDWTTSSCPEQYICDCYELAQEFRSQEASIQFWVAIVLGFIAIIGGMMLPSKNELNEWVGAGFILGGIITLFIATAMYWSEIHRIARPIVIALELGVVLWIAYHQFKEPSSQKKKKKKK